MSAEISSGMDSVQFLDVKIHVFLKILEISGPYLFILPLSFSEIHIYKLVLLMMPYRFHSSFILPDKIYSWIPLVDIYFSCYLRSIICMWFLFIIPISLLIFSFCSYIIFLGSFSSLSKFKAVFKKIFLCSRSIFYASWGTIFVN